MPDSAAYDATARTPVDPAEAVSGVRIGVVLIGISITLPLLYSARALVLEVDAPRCFGFSVDYAPLGAL